MIGEQHHTDQSIVFIDTEIEPKSKRVLDIGAVKSKGDYFHKNSISAFAQFIHGTKFLCGHNILRHDIRYIGHALSDANVNAENIIDTLFLSPLLYPTKTYHALLKDDKLQTEESNNPVNDSIKAKDLFYKEIEEFNKIDNTLKEIFYLLLKDKKEFSGFFRYISFTTTHTDPKPLILQRFANEICEQIDLSILIATHTIALAYCLSLIDSFIHHKEDHSITPPWVLKNYPEVELIMFQMRNKPCLSGCTYCNNALDIHKGLKRFFGFNTFRKYGDEPLQEKAVKAAIDNKSLIAVFPTGGGKSITFQVPALMSGESSKALTIVISPLQSLMKDQVDNLEKASITDAVMINGLLNAAERGPSFERVANGSASILYISPESLRSKVVERLILGRKIARFVIDEAHCFSSWGHDFRVDYLYIGDFIKLIQEQKNLAEPIPVSCFTATAKQEVIADIRDYFKSKLSLHLELFNSKASRTNLQYQVFSKTDEEEKYQTLRDLIGQKNCPVIIYVSRTKKAYALAAKLLKNGFNARPYHGKMDKQEKSDNQDAFIRGEIQIIVATSAFGMGVDKKDVGMVIHYEISDSLENYIQEAGRAGRDEKIVADCYILYDEDDLGKHFILLNQTKLSIKEIQQIWNAIKGITKFRSSVSNSALEIARKAGWDDSVVEIETRVTTAIAALEDVGYLKRGQNMPRVFADSILSRNVEEAVVKINASERFEKKQKVDAIRIIKKLLSSKSRKNANDETPEARTDYIGEHLGLENKRVIEIVNLLREEGILADAKDLTAFIKKGENSNRSASILESFRQIENFFLSVFEEQEKTYRIKELNESAELNGCDEVNIKKITTLLNFWAIRSWISRKKTHQARNRVQVRSLHSKEVLTEKLEKRHELARFFIAFLYEKSILNGTNGEADKEEVLVEFSVLELKTAYENGINLRLNINIKDIEDTLYYLSKIEAIKMEGGFLVVYNRLTIQRTAVDNKKGYTKEDYQKLHQFYENKVQQIHIVGEYASKMMTDYNHALQFVDDYFHLNYDSFINKYFNSKRQEEIRRNLTPAKYKQLIGALSPQQKGIINDDKTKYIVVAAGPGSGKTKVLVHKLASLLLREDVKHEQLLMLTFSRAAATEFKKRLIQLIGNPAHYIEIKTFHSYCFDLLGKVGSLETSQAILNETIEKINNGEVEVNRITKTVLVIDEAQDMNEEEFNLVLALIAHNEEMRIIAVGDDDQNIYAFRKADFEALAKLIARDKARKYELVENYRSKRNLVDFANQFVKQIDKRLKEIEIVANQSDNGKIKLFRYHSQNLIDPLVNNMRTTELTGSTCVLTTKNEHAAIITTMLLKNNMQAKLIQENKGFNLYNLLEVRYFLSRLSLDDGIFIISDDSWRTAKRELVQKFRDSTKLEVCKNIIKDFEATNPTIKYKSDLEVFVRESKIEDFFMENGEIIFVSTIHKAKGKEFDNVFLLLENFSVLKEEKKREFYVAITRAKTNLTIHLNTNFLDALSTENMERIEDHRIYPPVTEKILHLSHEDVNLGYFNFTQHRLDHLISGDSLVVKADGCANSHDELVLKFSKKFLEIVEKEKSKGYLIKEAKVNYVVYWPKDGSAHELKIILPELYFEKNNI